MTLSCGLLLHTPLTRPPIKVLLVHPGGPFWRGKDDGAWSIPKGLPAPGEDPLEAAKREFKEETGLAARPPFRELAPIIQKSGKHVRCWSFEADECPVQPGASTFEIEWPPRSGKRQTFPEVDAIAFFTLTEARTKLLSAQLPLLEQIAAP
jgi:predicted NUDIX family NTP pyrophosphohydrolase